jgi:hypothetical protein
MPLAPPVTCSDRSPWPVAGRTASDYAELSRCQNMQTDHFQGLPSYYGLLLILHSLCYSPYSHLQTAMARWHNTWHETAAPRTRQAKRAQARCMRELSEGERMLTERRRQTEPWVRERPWGICCDGTGTWATVPDLSGRRCWRGVFGRGSRLYRSDRGEPAAAFPHRPRRSPTAYRTRTGSAALTRLVRATRQDSAWPSRTMISRTRRARLRTRSRLTPGWRGWSGSASWSAGEDAALAALGGSCWWRS